MANGPQNLFDVSKYLKDFDPTKMVEEMAKALKQYSLPGVDMNALVESQKRNLEALTTANRVAFQGIQAVAKRQAEILQETMNETTKAIDTLSKSSSPQEIAANQADLAKQAFERALANMKELAELVSKAQEETTAAINSRVSAALDEIKAMALAAKKA